MTAADHTEDAASTEQTPSTDAASVVRLFDVTPTAHRKHTEWANKPKLRRAGVIDTVMAHRTTALYRISPAMIDDVLTRSTHPLGDIKKRDVEDIELARDWHPSYAFTHLLHYQLERVGNLPTWDEFRAFLLETPEGHEMFGHEARTRHRAIVDAGHPSELAQQALTWRVGTAYYGIVRDIYTLVHLRALGLDVRAHPLADALFRVDLWFDRHLLSVRIRNPRYASRDSGRKTPPQEILEGADPPFSFHRLELDICNEYGVLHIPSPDSIRVHAGHLLGALRNQPE